MLTAHILSNPCILEVTKLNLTDARKIVKESRELNSRLTSRGSSRSSSRSDQASHPMNKTKDPVPLIKAAKKSFWNITGSIPHGNIDYLAINTNLGVRSALRTMVSLGLPSRIMGYFGKHKFEFSIDRHNVKACAITGVRQISTHDGRPRLHPVSIDILNDSLKEPNYDIGDKKIIYKVIVSTSQLVAGKKYVLFRYKNLNDVPTALTEVAESRHESALYFRAEGDTWAVRDIINSNTTAYYRCMEAVTGETERFSPIRPYSPGRPGMADTDTDENFDDTDIDGVNELRDAIFEKDQQKSPHHQPYHLKNRNKLQNVEEVNELPAFMRKRKKKRLFQGSRIYKQEAENF